MCNLEENSILIEAIRLCELIIREGNFSFDVFFSVLTFHSAI